MEFEQIKELIGVLNNSEKIWEFSLKKGQTEIKIKKISEVVEENTERTKTSAVVYVPEQKTESERQVVVEKKEEVQSNLNENLYQVTSPMVGTFYASPSPEVDNYVSVGSKVNKQSVVCIVEAMKLFNEIQAEVDGEIVEVLAENGQLVEFGQPLFSIRLNGGAK